jgi:Rod binding domain-containing protein
MSTANTYYPVQKPHNMTNAHFASLKEKATELEGVFLNTLMSEMVKASDTEGMFGGGYAEETWRGMLGEEYANNMAGNGGIGLADDILRDLILSQQSINAPRPAAAQPNPAYVSGAYQQ